MKYVIYGAGYRGKRLLNYIGAEKVAAFIDIDMEKQKKGYCGKPVVSIEKYIKTYFTCFIIITPACIDNIENVLEQHNIYQYSNLSEMPSEFAGYGECKFESSYKEIIFNTNDKYCCYGLNVLSLLIFDYLYKKREISIYPEKGCKLEKIEWVQKYHPEIKLKSHSDIQDKEIILMSVLREHEVQFSNTAVNLFEHASNNKLYLNEKLQKFKDIYKNKKCFIVATGPSLRIQDLHILKRNKIFCFGVNSILKVGREWRSDVYVATDSHFINNNIEDIQNYKCKYKFIGDSCQKYWETKGEDSYKIHVTSAGSGIAGFSEEICQKIYCGYGGSGTVTYACIQLAVYMGFSEIYLLGVDCNYIAGSKNNHFIEDMVEDKMNHKEDSMIKAYEYAKKYAEAHEIKIYNATRGGKLEVFERVDFDRLFEY